MYSTIMVPIDLDHADTVEKAIKIAVDIAKIYNAEIYLAGVTATSPGSVAHNPEGYGEKLTQFTAEHSQSTGYPLKPRVVICNDPAAELDVALEKAGKEIGVDLVVMASHIPDFMDHLFHSKTCHLASHTDISVFIVR